MKIYGIYDEKNNEQCIRVGGIVEIIKFLNISARRFDRVLKKNEYIDKRYKLYYLFEE